MGFLVNRIGVLSACVHDRLRHGLPEQDGPLDDEVLFILDGVGGFQFSPVMIRRVLRNARAPIGTVCFRWQWGLVGEIWTDLMWLRRNRVMGAQLARRMLAMRRAHPHARLHLLAMSGGAGIAVFACESLAGRPIIDTLILGCPAVSPAYNLAPALRAVQRGYAWVSARDRFLLGAGTTIFGTIDRRFGAAAGKLGFCLPQGIAADDRALYDRLRQVHWAPNLKSDGHYGGHTGWLNERFLQTHLLSFLRGQPTLPVDAVGA